MMNPQHEIRQQCIGGLPARTGFSLIEVLFAVMILGLGFIMVAAVLPVGGAQTQATMDDTYGWNLARSGLRCMEVGMRQSNTPAASILSRLPTGSNQLGLLVAGNRIHASDPRFAWIGLYNRSGNIGSLWSIAVRCRNRSQYLEDELANIDVVDATIDLRLSPNRIVFAAGAGRDAAVEGAWVIAKDGVGPFVLGNPTTTAGEWLVAPGGGGISAAANGRAALIVGRQLRNPSKPYNSSPGPNYNPYEGPSQFLTTARLASFTVP